MTRCDFCEKEKDEDMTQINDFMGGPLEMDMVTRYMCKDCCDKYAETYISGEELNADKRYTK